MGPKLFRSPVALARDDQRQVDSEWTYAISAGPVPKAIACDISPLQGKWNCAVPKKREGQWREVAKDFRGGTDGSRSFLYRQEFLPSLIKNDRWLRYHGVRFLFALPFNRLAYAQKVTRSTEPPWFGGLVIFKVSIHTISHLISFLGLLHPASQDAPLPIATSAIECQIFRVPFVA